MEGKCVDRVSLQKRKQSKYEDKRNEYRSRKSKRLEKVHGQTLKKQRKRQ